MLSTALSGDLFKELNLQAWWNKVDHLMKDKFRTSSTPSMMVTRDFLMETDSTIGVYGAKLAVTSDIGIGQLDTGIDYYLRNRDAVNTSAMFNAYEPQPLLPDVDTNNVGAFVEYLCPVGEQLKFSGGARIDYTDVEAKTLTDAPLIALYGPVHGVPLSNSADFTEVSGNLQLFWFPSNGVEVFTGQASAVRPPDAQELYIGLDRPIAMPSWVGNPNLNAPRNNQADLGVKFSGNRYYLSTSVYYSLINDYINLTSVPAVGTFYQNVDAEMYGGELAG
jgi:iron complex outermembrane receptor protein